MASTEHYFYVVRCADNTYYAGYTTDVERRIWEHNYSEKGAKYTRIRRPIQLVYFRCYDSRALATKAEAMFKKLTRKQKEQYLYGTTTEKF